MSDIVYTREVDSDAISSSSAVDEVYYNENTGDLYVDLNNYVYRYSNVPVSKVDEFEVADSAGSFYASEIKPNFGPSENLGYWSALEYIEVDVDEPVETAVAVPHFTIHGNGAVTQNVPVKAETFSLKPFAEPVRVEGVEREYIVTFEVEGIVDFKRHTLKSTSVDEAVAAVLDLGKMLELNFVVREVTIRFV